MENEMETTTVYWGSTEDVKGFGFRAYVSG